MSVLPKSGSVWRCWCSTNFVLALSLISIGRRITKPNTLFPCKVKVIRMYAYIYVYNYICARSLKQINTDPATLKCFGTVKTKTANNNDYYESYFFIHSVRTSSDDARAQNQLISGWWQGGTVSESRTTRVDV